MRSRSSRLFIVLLHLVGVSTHLPRNSFFAALFPNGNGIGIVGVHPLSILLEPLELQEAGGLEELLELLEVAGYDVEESVLREPFWLQDDTDGKCLGPTGFSECGDATLWMIRRRPVSSSVTATKRRNRYVLKENETISMDAGNTNYQDSRQHHWKYSLEIADSEPLQTSSFDESTNRDNRKKYLDGECIAVKSDGSLGMASCALNEVWSWHINGGGVLEWEGTALNRIGSYNQEVKGKVLFGGALARLIQNEETPNGKSDEATSLCVWRKNETFVSADQCNSREESGSHAKKLVNFSVVQYQSSAAVSPKLPRFSDPKNSSNAPPTKDSNTEEPQLTHESQNLTKSHSPIPRGRRVSQSHAAVTSLHPELKHPSTTLFATTSQKRGNQVTTARHQVKSPLGVGGYSVSSPLKGKIKTNESKGKILHHPSAPAGAQNIHDDTPHRPRKIPAHPYLTAAKNGIYVDPQTGLKFPTDLSEYLGHDRKSSGRHTLMGVGIYARTMLKIKIYVVALYVPKRDVLYNADLSSFASMSVEELRQSTEFYDHLLTMKPNPQNNFDRSIFIKLNMQLATETLRQSIEADWTHLSLEHKKLLTESSFKTRPAERAMLDTIESEENTSNCSCGQAAPEEYESDPSCCARGTELVFTWRKNGNLELRLDGRIMDIFPCPEMAKGIFYEYIRGDDPISMDARDHFADGFPFLLAPLAQVRGVSYPVHDESANGKDSTTKKEGYMSDINNIFSDVIGMININVNGVSSWVQGNIEGGITNVGSTMRRMANSTQHLGEELEQRKIAVLGQMSNVRHHSSQFVASRILRKKRQLVLFNHTDIEEEAHDKPEGSERKKIFSKMFKALAGQRPLTDEISVIIEPTMSLTHLLFLYMVHFYLVLLLIVSLPDSCSTRLVMKRSSVCTMDSESDSDDLFPQDDDISSESMGSIAQDEEGRQWVYGSIPPQICVQRLKHDEKLIISEEHNRAGSGGNMKKALSFVL